MGYPYSLSQIESVTFSLTTEEDEDLPKYDHTALNAISECPTWGIVRYLLHKTMSSSRSMALEAGAAFHDAAAAIRLADLYNERANDEVFYAECARLFSSERLKSMLEYFFSSEDRRTRELNFALEALNTSGYYDDPRDKKRTLTNLEECVIAYYDRWPSNRGEGSTIIGIEWPVDFVITFASLLHGDGTNRDYDTLKVRYIGKMDGLHRNKDGKLVVHENKTASRIDDSWLSGMRMSHQVTGYVVAASLMCAEPCDTAYVHGAAIPLPKNYDFGGIVREKVTRGQRAIYDWLNWILWGHEQVVRHKHEVYTAPRFTRSCNRFNHTCAFMPLCDVDSKEEFIATLNEMETDEWNPLKVS